MLAKYLITSGPLENFEPTFMYEQFDPNSDMSNDLYTRSIVGLTYYFENFRQNSIEASNLITSSGITLDWGQVRGRQASIPEPIRSPKMPSLCNSRFDSCSRRHGIAIETTLHSNTTQSKEKDMKTSMWGILILISIGLSACAPASVFSPEVLEGVDPNFDFSRWRMMPNQAGEKKIGLGGRIIHAETKGDHATIVVAQLPIVENIQPMVPKITVKAVANSPLPLQARSSLLFSNAETASWSWE